MRRVVTEPKIGFSGVMLAVSLAMFRPLMATFNAERISSCPFGRWDLSVMVGMRGSHEKAVRCGGCEDGSEPLSRWAPTLVSRLVRWDAFGGEHE